MDAAVGDGVRKIVRGFGVEVAAELLEMRSDGHEVGVIELLGEVPPTAVLSPAAHGTVGVLELIEPVLRQVAPVREGLRWHQPSVYHPPLTLIFGGAEAGEAQLAHLGGRENVPAPDPDRRCPGNRARWTS